MESTSFCARCQAQRAVATAVFCGAEHQMLCLSCLKASSSASQATQPAQPSPGSGSGSDDDFGVPLQDEELLQQARSAGLIVVPAFNPTCQQRAQQSLLEEDLRLKARAQQLREERAAKTAQVHQLYGWLG